MSSPHGRGKLRSNNGAVQSGPKVWLAKFGPKRNHRYADQRRQDFPASASAPAMGQGLRPIVEFMSLGRFTLVCMGSES